jgi:hypothetical protein
MRYKYHIVFGGGRGFVDKADPLAFCSEMLPGTASLAWNLQYDWCDEQWMQGRKSFDITKRPINSYEMHLGSWQAWTQVSLAAVILMGALGAVTGKRMGAIRRACASAMTIDAEQTGQLQDPFLKFSLGIRISVFLGIVLIMAALQLQAFVPLFVS